MILELFIVFQIVTVGIFLAAFFTHQELLWGLSLIFSAVMMYTSYTIEFYQWIYNSTIGVHQQVMTSVSYPYLMGLNFLFFALTILLGLYDIFDKFGQDIAGRER